MSQKHLLLAPHNIQPGCRWYEENHGVTLVVEHRNYQGGYIQTKQYKISWRSLRAALKRKDKK